MGCGTSKLPNIVTPAPQTSQTGKYEKVDGKVSQKDVDSHTAGKIAGRTQDTSDSVDKGRTQLSIIDHVPTISLSSKELPLAKAVESSSESYLEDSDSGGKEIRSEEHNSETKGMHIVEKTEKVFITQDGSIKNGDSCLESTPLSKEVLPLNEKDKSHSRDIKLEDLSVIKPGNVEEKKDDIPQVSESADVDAIPAGSGNDRQKDVIPQDQMQLQDSNAVPSEIDNNYTEKDISQKTLEPGFKGSLDFIGAPQVQTAVECKEGTRQDKEEDVSVVPSIHVDEQRKISREDVKESPHGGATPTSCHIISQTLESSESLEKNLVEKKSSYLPDKEEGKSLSADFEQVVIEKDMVCESVNDACIDEGDLNDEMVTMEITSDLTVGKATEKSKQCVCFEGAMDTTKAICECNATEMGKSSIAMTTNLDNKSKVITIRIEVDDEFEHELASTHSRENIKGSVSSGFHGNRSHSKMGKTGECDGVVPEIQIHVEGQSKKSSSLLAPDTSETATSAQSLNDILGSTGSFGRSPSWNAERQSKMEKLMNEELDVHPSLRDVSPALGFARSMQAACLAEVDEEGEEEKTGEKDDKESTKGNLQDSEKNKPMNITDDAGKELDGDSRFVSHEQTASRTEISQGENNENEETLDDALPNNDVAIATKPSSDSKTQVNAKDENVEASLDELLLNNDVAVTTNMNRSMESHASKSTESHLIGEDKTTDGKSGSRMIESKMEAENCMDASIGETIDNNAIEKNTYIHFPSENENILNDDLVNPDCPVKSANVVTTSNHHVTSTNGNNDLALENMPSNDSSHVVSKDLTLNSGVANGNSHVTEDSPSIPNDQPDRESQRKLVVALRFACKALPWQHICDQASSGVTSLNLSRTLRSLEYGTGDLVRSLRNLKKLDISNNVLGPQGFRVVCLGVALNKTLTSLNMANNSSDTESSKALGHMLSRNTSLEYLDVSGNDLGKDYFSHCVGPALQINKSLKTLKCASCGANDMSAILEALSGNHGNRILAELDVSNNQLGEKFGKGLEDVLKIPDCSLKYLDVHATNLGVDGMTYLLNGIQNNKSLVRLNASGHNVHSLSFIMDLIYSCTTHPVLQDLSIDNSKPTEMNEWDKKAITESSKPSSSNLTSLSIAACSLNDVLLASLADETKGLLSKLAVINLSGNTDITGESLCSGFTMITTEDDKRTNVLEYLDFALNNAEAIPDVLCAASSLSSLKHLSLRKARISPAKLTELRQCLFKNSMGNDVSITSLNLDSIKLSGTNALQSMLGLSDDFVPTKPLALTSLSLSCCSLNDRDVKPLFLGIAKGLSLVHVTLSSNRLTDTSIDWLVDAMDEPCSLCHLDLANNKIRSPGAEKLASAIAKGKLTHLATLLLGNNNVGSSGILALVSQVAPHGTLHSLNFKDQQQPVGEDDMDEILKTLGGACGIPLDNNSVTASNTYLEFSPQTSINLTGLGGEPGDYGPLLDSIAIQTDYSKKHKRTLNFQDALGLCAVLANTGNSCEPMLSKEDWDLVISADKDAPAWLQVSSHRKCTVYISNLPLTATREKLESLLEDDADCNVKEVFLSKDPILRKPNGLAWALFKDETSVQKAMEYYHSGQAQCFGRPFVVSPIKVNVQSSVNKRETTEQEARKEMAIRDELRKADEKEKAAIVQAKFAESSARHEYAAQHPAYADGRIW